MTFRVTTEQMPAGRAGHKVWVLEDTEGARAEVCPELGFNCFRWRAIVRGRPVEMLYATPTFLAGDRPTRSGIPVLFPFPNRIRDGRFTWAGKEYQLPGNDSTSKNAIHGFACRRPWRVIDQGADAASAWVTGEFHLSQDDPDSRPLWPADHRIRLTCRLASRRLRLEASVDNPNGLELPFGLGYHPYFRVPGGADFLVQSSAALYWELENSLPTGARLPVDAKRDLRQPRRYAQLQLDDVLTGLDEWPALGQVMDEAGQVRLALFASEAFRELVAFTPVHREAVCLEPYTSTTDAINLQQRGVDAGLLVLPPGGTWTASVEMDAGRFP